MTTTTNNTQKPIHFTPSEYEIIGKEIAEMRQEMKRLQAKFMEITLREYNKPCPF